VTPLTDYTMSKFIAYHEYLGEKANELRTELDLLRTWLRDFRSLNLYHYADYSPNFYHYTQRLDSIETAYQIGQRKIDSFGENNPGYELNREILSPYNQVKYQMAFRKAKLL